MPCPTSPIWRWRCSPLGECIHSPAGQRTAPSSRFTAPLSAIEDNRLSGNGTGLKSGSQSQATGKSKGGWTTKILALTDALGNLVRFVLLPGHRFDTAGVAPLIDGISFDAILAPSHGLPANHCRATDKAYDSNWIIADMNARGALICISQHPRRCKPLQIDPEIHKFRHLIENFFCKLKEFKRITMRADKTDTSFKAMIYAVAAIINSR